MTNTKTAKVQPQNVSIEERVAALPTPKRVGGNVASFRDYTLGLADIYGWTPTVTGATTTFSRGEDRLTVTYSERGYVRKVEGRISGKPVTILPGNREKWISLNRRIAGK